MTPIARAAEHLARVALAGPFTLALVTQRVRQALGRCPRWLSPVLKSAVAEFGEGTRPRLAKVACRLRQVPELQQAVLTGRLNFIGVLPRQGMCPATGAPQMWNLPALTTVADLAAWLNLSPGELEWFADVCQLNHRTKESRLGHYRYRWVTKRNGGARLLESPKLRLKLLQRRLLRHLVEQIPPHEAAHGFRRGRSVRSFVAEHTGQAIVLRFDLRDFFPSVTRSRVLALLLTAGYPEPVALRLAALCTAHVPREIMARCPERLTPADAWQRAQRYSLPHLPQGAPTSPALANLAAHSLDRRLTGLAATVHASYTRYADDLVFSGGPELARQAERFAAQVGAIALETGFALNHRKTRIMRQGVSQRAAGLVLNRHPNVPRRDFDALKATLHNCVRRGPDGENREGVADFRGHLRGRIAYLTQINAARGARLMALLEQIHWP